jgi:predicted nucleotidyltransferase
LFTKIIEGRENPTDIVFEVKRAKIKTTMGRFVKGYELTKIDKEPFVAEKFRPSLYDSEEQEWKWVVPEEIIDFLKDRDGEPITLIDLFLLLKDQFSGIDEKDIKVYAIRLVDNNVLDLRRAREKWI